MVPTSISVNLLLIYITLSFEIETLLVPPLGSTDQPYLHPGSGFKVHSGGQSFGFPTPGGYFPSKVSVSHSQQTEGKG